MLENNLNQKSCKKCGLLKDKHKRCPNCKNIYQRTIMKDYHKAYAIQWALDNEERLKKYHQSWYLENAERISDILKNDPIKKNNKREVANARETRLRNTNPVFKLKKNVSRIIGHALKGRKNGKSVSKYLNYTFDDLKVHLENQFDDKMSWENYGSYWHVDHIYPQSLLPYFSMEDEKFKKCWMLENLRPLEAVANIKKSNKIIEGYDMSFIKRGDDQQIKLVDPDELSPEQKELVEKVAEQEENLEHQKENGNQPS